MPLPRSCLRLSDISTNVHEMEMGKEVGDGEMSKTETCRMESKRANKKN